jgi:aminoglycoside phosphotransferase
MVFAGRERGREAAVSFIGRIPDGSVVVPAAVAGVAAGRTLTPVWVNAVGGTTFRVGDPDPRRTELYVKWVPPHWAPWVDDEAARLTWAARWLRVPEVVAHDHDDEGAWLVTRPVPGWSAVDARWRDEPRTAVIAVGEGLRAMHDTLPVDDCPWRWSTAERRDRAAAAGRDVATLGPGPAPDRDVVCHGDACAPNTLIGADRRWAGHVDLGALGVADRWADLAVATLSLGWNHGPGWDTLFHEAYGEPQDVERTAWYRALYALDVDDVDDPRRRDA